MGWANGTSVMKSLVEACMDAGLESGQKYIIYEAVVESLRDLDWDTMDEVYGDDSVLDEVLEEHGFLGELHLDEDVIEDEEEIDKEDSW